MSKNPATIHPDSTETLVPTGYTETTTHATTEHAGPHIPHPK
jgi:hypothetical protein